MNMTNAKQDEAGGAAAKIRVRLKAGREKQIVRGSAWIFSGAIEEVDGAGAAGEPADVFDTEGEWLGWGLWHPAADMTVRMFTQDPREALDLKKESFLLADRRAVATRHRLFGAPGTWRDTNAYRLVFSGGGRPVGGADCRSICRGGGVAGRRRSGNPGSPS